MNKSNASNNSLGESDKCESNFMQLDRQKFPAKFSHKLLYFFKKYWHIQADEVYP